ncbi:class I SAM-dependent methyltransferase [Vibrio sp. 99-8-1]|uniref:class I SAM-dependent methyltransferase n=1 Tax=Vibrio sp. 99-8-1 TaxID=2607602 RepID=UPI001493515D|nr:class I SAM-dependent methyltransferase [Vibrio sp. 99-8-1]NOI68719.1 class I SAM-dependent methyltransferase [Vibrio sp. 99-8-1]
MFSESDKSNIIERYTKRFEKHGHSPISLGWDKGKQMLRYLVLLDKFKLENKKILDIGCGFGDGIKAIEKYTDNFTYLGIDVVPCLIDEANRNNNRENVRFLCSDFLCDSFVEEFDIIIGSGIFNFKLKDEQNYDFIRKVIEKSFKLSNVGIAFDFLSSKVDFKLENTFHSEPTEILELFYEYSRNISLDNSIMPFEYTVHGFIDNFFDKSDTTFSSFKSSQIYQNAIKLEK